MGVRFLFEAGADGAMNITGAKVLQQGGSIISNITFNGGNADVLVPAGTNVWSDWVTDFEINRYVDYVVTFDMGGVGDQDLDLFVGHRTPQTILYKENIGTPTVPNFAAGIETPALVSVTPQSYSAPEFADMDADGDPDLFLGNHSLGSILYFENTGTAANAAMSLIDSDLNSVRQPLSRPTVVDIDNDGDFDLFVIGLLGRINFYENTGTIYAAKWKLPDTLWKGIQASGNYGAIAFADLDDDGDLDLLLGKSYPPHLTYYENTGDQNDFEHSGGTQNYLVLEDNTDGFSTPEFADIDDDGDFDLFVGTQEGRIYFYENTGTVAVADFSYVTNIYAGVTFGNNSYVRPSFVNINPDNNTARTWTKSGVTLSYTNGVATDRIYALSRAEVRYPATAIYRSGIVDTGMTAPAYKELNWTEKLPADTDVQIRIRSDISLSAIVAAPWTEAEAGNRGYFAGNTANDLTGLPSKRYFQYEARLTSGGTYSNTAALRDVTVDWDVTTRSVDLLLQMTRGPDYGIIEARIGGDALTKGVEVLVEIKGVAMGRTNIVSGTSEVRPLNTGK